MGLGGHGTPCLNLQILIIFPHLFTGFPSRFQRVGPLGVRRTTIRFTEHDPDGGAVSPEPPALGAGNDTKVPWLSKPVHAGPHRRHPRRVHDRAARLIDSPRRSLGLIDRFQRSRVDFLGSNLSITNGSFACNRAAKLVG